MSPHISRRCLFISNRAKHFPVPKLMAREEQRFWEMTTTSNKHLLHILLLDSSTVVYPSCSVWTFGTILYPRNWLDGTRLA
jgi:hypothetical protein